MCEAPGRQFMPSRGLRAYYARMLLPLVATGAALGAWAYGTYEPNSPLFGRVIGRGSRAGRVVYLTFDDGPNPGATEPILQTPAAEGLPAAFFLVGEHVRRFPQVARRVAQAGHEIGNHTLRHRKLHFAGPARIREELERTHALIVETTGRAPRAFRAPHGYRNPFIASATRRLGYTVFGWTFGVWDSDPRVAAEEIRRRVRTRLRPGAIVLLHDGTGAGRRRPSRASSPMRAPPAIGSARSRSSSPDVAPLALGVVAPGPGGYRLRAQVLHGVSLARHVRRAARRQPVAARGRTRGQPFVARRQRMGVAPGAETGGAAQLAPGPGGKPGRGGGERSVGRRGRGGGACARDRTASGCADRRRRVVGGVDPTGRSAGLGAVSGHGAQPARARAVAARAAGGRGA